MRSINTYGTILNHSIESELLETCNDISIKCQEYDITSDNAEFDKGTSVEEDDNDDELSDNKFDVKDILDCQTLLCVISHVQYLVK